MAAVLPEGVVDFKGQMTNGLSKNTFVSENSRFIGCTPLRGHMATLRSKKGSEKVLGRVLGKGSQKGF